MKNERRNSDRSLPKVPLASWRGDRGEAREGGGRVLPFPAILRAEVKDGHVVLTFDQPLQEGAVHGFEVCEADNRFRNVTATATANTVILDAANATRVRYAWKSDPQEADLTARDGVSPAIPFEITTNN